MRVLVTGASGFVGRALVHRLLADGHRVVGVSRQTDGPPRDARVSWLRMPALTDAPAWAAALAGVDGVVHLAARTHAAAAAESGDLAAFRADNVEPTRALAAHAQAANVRRFVFVSSIKAVGERSERPLTERDSPAPEDAYGVSKLEAEHALADELAGTGTTYTIVRPPLVYGPGVQANLRRLTQAVVRGWPLPFGAVDNRRSFLGSANLADLLVRCLEHPGAANTVFLASDGVDLSTADLVRRIARAADRPARLLPVPAGVVERALRWVGQAAAADKLLGSLPIDSSRARERLAWQPPVSVQEGLSEMTAEVARAKGRR